MQKNAARVIQINPKSKHNRLFLLSLGFLLLCICLILYPLFGELYRLQLIFIISASFVVFLVGLLKYLEPAISYVITPDSITYYHRSGHWGLPWRDVLRIGDITASVMAEHKHLPYLGIRVNSLENIAQSISPRLANKLLHEQQELLLLALKNQEIELQNGVINFEPFNLNGVIYKGPVAAWLYRTELLQKAYGYHLFLPESSFDRGVIEFLSLLKECHNYIKNDHN
ncbi:DUF2982 domain-containing protein [Psychromonas sp.]|uniref:DUF2982 domain-containing protein n=1 Tax=Psychromonas sp. TaxID=1884585 RepID=UPI003569A6E5